MSNAQILVVEDERIVARSIQSELQNMGYTVPALASTGEEALRQAAETLPDLVLMDIALQGDMDGVETSQHIRERFDLPVVYLTAFADEQTLQRAKLTEPYGYLLKPYEERELHTTIELALYKHRLERKLHETEHWLQATLHCLGDAVLGTDALGNIRMMNAAAEDLTGWQRREAEGQDIQKVFALQGEPAGRVNVDPVTRAFQKGAAVALADGSILVAKNGKMTPVEGNVAPIHDDKGFFVGFVLVFRDISLRRQAEEARRVSKESYPQAHQGAVLDTLARGMAGELNNLLTGVLGGLCVVLARLPKTDPNRPFLLTAEHAAWQAAQLIKQGTGDGGQAKPRLETLDLNALIRKALPDLGDLMGPRLQIEFQPGPTLATVRADPVQINEVLINLCHHARAARPASDRLLLETLNVTVGKDDRPAIPQATPGDYVCLRISHGGHAITPEVPLHLFEPFSTTSPSGNGMAQGLAVVIGIVQLHGGWVECDANLGNQFDVYLPRFVEATGEARI